MAMDQQCHNTEEVGHNHVNTVSCIRQIQAQNHTTKFMPKGFLAEYPTNKNMPNSIHGDCTNMDIFPALEFTIANEETSEYHLPRA